MNLVFSENYTEEFDYLIVSDGVFSKTKSIILKKDTRPKYFDSLAIRGNISDYKSKDISLYLSLFIIKKLEFIVKGSSTLTEDHS